MKAFKPKKRDYNKTIRALSRKKDVRNIDQINGTLTVDMSKKKVHDLGNDSWGAIDYLQKMEGFAILYYYGK